LIDIFILINDKIGKTYSFIGISIMNEESHEILLQVPTLRVLVGQRHLLDGGEHALIALVLKLTVPGLSVLLLPLPLQPLMLFLL